MSVWLGSPRSKSFMIGMRSPSSKTSRASAERIRPPISALWQVLANNATILPLRKIGVVIVISLIWPAVCHGSLVISTSPGANRSGGNAARKCFIEVAMALIWPGVPLSDWAIILPLVSNIPHARSWLSRTIVLKAVRMSASCCSLATERKRFQITSRATGSIVLVSMGQLHDHIESFIHPRPSAHANDQSRLPFFDDRRAVKVHPRRQRISVVENGIDVPPVFGEIGRARTLAFFGMMRRLARQLEIHCRWRSACHHTPVDYLQGHIGSFSSVQGSIRLFERRGNWRQMLRTQSAVGQGDGNFMTLTNIAHI